MFLAEDGQGTKWSDADELVRPVMHRHSLSLSPTHTHTPHTLDKQMWILQCLFERWFSELSERMEKECSCNHVLTWACWLYSVCPYCDAKYHFSISIMIRYVSLCASCHKMALKIAREWEGGRSALPPQPLLSSTTSLSDARTFVLWQLACFAGISTILGNWYEFSSAQLRLCTQTDICLSTLRSTSTHSHSCCPEA